MGSIGIDESAGSVTVDYKQGLEDFSNLTNKMLEAHNKAHLAYDAAQKQSNAADEIFDGSLHKLFKYDNPSIGGKYSEIVEQSMSTSEQSLISSHEALKAVNEHFGDKDPAHEFLTKGGVGDSLNHFHDANFVNFDKDLSAPDVSAQQEESDVRSIYKMWDSIWLNVGR